MNYAFDPTGALLSNVVVGEEQSVNMTQGSSAFVFLSAGPFYKSDLVIAYAGVAGEFSDLIYGTDYVFDLQMRGASYDSSNPIHGAIRLLNPQLYGTLRISYRALGGPFVINQRQILEYEQSNSFNSNLVYRALTPVDPIVYPNSTELVLPTTPESLAYLVNLGRVISLGESYLLLPAGEQVITDDGALFDALGNTLTQAMATTPTNGTVTPIEGGNSNAVKITGAVQATIANPTQFAQEATLIRVANAVEAQTPPTNFAVENGGNLTSIAQTTGTGTDTAYAGSGPTTIIGALKGIYNRFATALNIRPLTSATDSVTTVPSGVQSVAVAQLPTSLGQHTKTDSLSVTLSSDHGPVEVSSAGGQLATSADIADVVNAVGANPTVAEILFVDDRTNSPQYYIRREVRRANSSTIDWLNVDGTAASVNVEYLRPAYPNASDAPVVTRYKAIALGAGFSQGNVLARIQAFRVDTGITKTIGETWLNLTTGSALVSAPSMSSLELYSEQVVIDTSGLALSSKQSALDVDGGSLVHVTNFPQVQPVQFSTPQRVIVDTLPQQTVTANIGTTAGLALDSSIQQLIAAVQASGGASSVTSTWVDNTQVPAVYYVRRETTDAQGGVTVSWETTSGQPATPVVANLSPYSAGGGGAVDLTRADTTHTLSYKATASGTGYLIDDVLVNVVGLNTDTSPATIVYTTWLNTGPSVSSPTVLSVVPTNGTYVEVTNPVTITSVALPSNAAQESGGNLAAIAAATGATGDAAYVSGAGTLVSLLKAVVGRLSGVLNTRTLSSSTDSVTIQGGNAIAVKTDGSAVTQPVSATTLPLPTGAAAENGNLATIASNTGSQSDAAYGGSGTATVISGLKGLYAKLSGVLNIRTLSSSTDSVAIQGGNATAVKTDGSAVTQPVSAVSLPLPSGAATETGNLASINTAVGAKSDAAWAGTGDGSFIAVIKAVYTRLGTVLNIRSLSAASDTVKVEGGNSAAVKTDGSGVTQPVSATALPLPTGAAIETGNLAVIANATGDKAEAAYSGTGNGTLVSLLKGVYVKLGTALNIRNLSSATDSVTIQGGNATAVKTDGSGVTQPVSAASLPLPSNAAQETGGNLSAISTGVTATNTALGTISDAAYAGTGNGSVISVLKGILAKLGTALNIRTLSSATDTVKVEGGNTSAVKVDGSSVVQPVSGSVTANIGTTAGLALDSSVQQLISAVKATVEISGTIWADNTVEPSKYYIRRESVNEGTGAITITWENSDGTVATPTVANLVPADAEANYSVQSETFTATAAGTGYSSGDILIHAYAIDNGQQPPRLAYSIWFNAGPSVASGTLLASAPTAGTYVDATQPVSVDALPLPSNAARETGGNLATLVTSTGAPSDAAYAGSGNATLVSALKGVYAAVSAGLSIRNLTSATDTVKVEGGNTTAVKTDGSGVTQPVSVASLPLPSGAARESGGTLSAISSATGAVTDVAYTGGDGSVVAVLKGLFTKLSGVLNTRQLSSATDSVTVQGGNAVAVKTDGSGVTQPVSAVSLPLPVGAAKETGGNLDAISAGIGSTADVSWTGTGTASVVAVLKGLYAKLSGVLNTRQLTAASDVVTVEGGNSNAVKVDGSAVTQPVSVTTLPLPSNAARETGGNLAAAATAIGAQTDTAYTGTGNTGLVGGIKGLYAAITGTLNVRSLSSATDTVKVEGGNTASVKVDGSAVTQPISASALPLPSGAATETGNLAVIASTQGAVGDASYTGVGNGTIVSVLKGIFGKLSAALNIRALSSATDTVKVEGGNVAAVKTDGSAVTQPISASALPLPTGAATETGNLGLIATATGNQADATWGGTGSASVISILKSIYGSIKGTLSIRNLTSATDTVKVEGGNTTAVKTDGSAVTQPISATALPLPTGAATETGNLATVATRVTAIDIAQGNQADAAYTGTGSASISSVLKGIYDKLGTVLNIRALSSATDTVKVEGGNSSAVKTDGSAVTQPVSAVSLPLPTGAATESGNLATIATQATAINAAQGNGATGVTMPAGGVGVMGWLSGIYAKLSGTINTTVTSLPSLPAGSNAIGSVTVSNLPASQQVFTDQLPSTLGTKTAANSLSVTLASDTSGFNVSSTGGALALDSSIQSLINTIKATTDFESTVWYDKTTEPTTYYIRRESVNEGTGAVTVSWENLDGTVATPTVANLASTKTNPDVEIISEKYRAISNGTGYVTNDILLNVFGLDVTTATPSITFNLWYNASTGAGLSVVPPSNTYTNASSNSVSVTSSVLPTGAATESGNLATIANAQGVGANGVTMPTGGSGILGWLSGIYNKLNSSVAVTGTFWQATQPVSAASLPLPTGAATESGNLATVAAKATSLDVATGTIADAAYAGAGNATVISALKGIFSKLSSTLTVTVSGTPTVNVSTLPALPAGSNAIGTVQVTNFPATQPVSAVSLPLPTGAATESGNLATIAAAQGTSPSGVTMPTGGAGILGWLGGIYNKLNTSVAVTGTFWQATQPVSAAALPLPTGAATETGNLATVAAKTTNIDTATGATSDVAYAGTGSSTVIGVLKGIYAKLANALTVTISGTPSVSVTALPALPAGSNAIGTVQVTNFPATQPVSATSLPLPTGAATETGNLATISTKATSIDTVQGAVADAAYSGTGSGTVVAVLKGIYAKLASTLTVSISGTPTVAVSTLPALPAGANAIGSVSVSNFPATQAVSATALPLPSGAATETGNLATIATNTAAISTAQGNAASGVTMPTGGAGVLGWLSGIFNKLNTSIAVTGTFYQATQPVSATALPLPTGAATETGNLATIASVQGAQADAAWTGTGNGTTISVLKAVYNRLVTANGLSIRALSSLNDSIKVEGGNSTAVKIDGTATTQPVSSTQLPASLGSKTMANSLSVSLASDTPTLNVTTPSGTPALDSTLQSMLTVLTSNKALAGTVWYDPTVTPFVYYVRRETLKSSDGSVTVAWETPSGTVVTPTVANLLPVDGAGDIETVSRSYQAIAAGTGYANGDMLVHVYGLNASASVPTLAFSIWFNAGPSVANGAILASAPTNGTYQEVSASTVSVSSSALPTNAAQETGGNLAAIKTAQGTVSDAAYSASGDGSVISILKGIWDKLAGTIAVSATALPLPTGAATESGNLATIASVQGTQADAAYAGSGNGTTISVLKSLYTLIGTTNSSMGATSAAAWSGTGNGTLNGVMKAVYNKLAASIAITAATLPLPTGAATETGNLATIVTNTGTANAALGTSADTSYVGTASTGTVISILKGIWDKLAATLTVTISGTPTVVVSTLPALPAGANAIGSVAVSNFPATQPVSATALPLPAGAATETGNLATIATEVTSIDTVQGAVADAAYAGSGNSTVVGALKGIYAKLASTIAVTQAAITKGVQGATGVTTQDLKDAGRNVTTYFMAAATLNAATEALVSLTGYKSGVQVTATSTPAVVSAGKKYRVTKITITYIGTAAIGYVKVNIRANTAGVVTLSSPIVDTISVGAGTATAGNNTTHTVTYPEGLEFDAGTGIGVSTISYNSTNVATAIGYSIVSIYGYEY